MDFTVVPFGWGVQFTWETVNLGPIGEQQDVLYKHLLKTPEGTLDMTGADWGWLYYANRQFPYRDFWCDGNILSWKRTDPATERAIEAYEKGGGFHYAGTLEEIQATLEKLRRKFPYHEFPLTCYINFERTSGAHT